MDVVYATRDDVTDALGSEELSLDGSKIDRALSAASRAIDARLHRTFYPELGTKLFSWPESRTLYLDNHELIELTSVSADAAAISLNAITLEPANDPPYDRLVSDDSAWPSSLDPRNIAVTGLWCGAPADEQAVADVASLSGTTLTVTDGSALAPGALVRIGAERMIIRERYWQTSGRTLASGLTATIGSAVVTLDGTADAPLIGETITVGWERMRVTDTNGTQILVRRARNGTALAAHDVAAPVLVPRRYRVERAGLGTTQGSASAGDDILLWRFPSPVRTLCAAEAISSGLDLASGMARTIGQGDGALELSGRGMAALWRRTYETHGRMARMRSV